MKPAICTTFDYSLSFDQTVSMISGTGFEIVCIGGNQQHSGYGTTAERESIRRVIGKYDMSIDSIHAPFPEGDQLFSLDETDRVESLRHCKNALDAAEDLDGGIVVIHLIEPYGIPEGKMRDKMIDQGQRSIETLAEYAYDRNGKLALENGQTAAYDRVLAKCLNKFDDAHIGFCYDSGHENVQGNCFHLLKQFGRRLMAVHLHDNEGRDTHMLPYEGTIDWSQFPAILSKLSYSGNLLLEVKIENSKFKNYQTFLRSAKKCADRLCPPEQI